MEVTNNFNYKITPSLQKRIEIIEKRFENPRQENFIQAYISKANLLVVDSVFKMSSGEIRYKRTFYGPRGGWNFTRWYREYDFTDNEPFALAFEERA